MKLTSREKKDIEKMNKNANYFLQAKKMNKDIAINPYNLIKSEIVIYTSKKELQSMQLFFNMKEEHEQKEIIDKAEEAIEHVKKYHRMSPYQGHLILIYMMHKQDKGEYKMVFEEI